MIREVKLITVALVLTGLLAACGAAETPAPAPTAVVSEPTATPEPPTPTPELPTPTPEPPTPTAEPSTPTSEPPTPTAEPPTPTSEPPTTEPATATPAPTDTPAAVAPQPQAAALTGRLYFPVYDEEAGTYNIYAADPDGGNRELVVEEASQPSVRSDGQTMAFRSWQADDRGLIERDLKAGTNIWTFDGHFEAGRPSFAPDDKSFMFQSHEAGEALAIYQTDGDEYDVLRRAANPIQGEAPAWTPDGESFVYKTCEGTHCGLYFSNLDGSALRQLTSDLSDTNPAVSPDGQTIAFMSERDGNWEIYTIDLDGENLTRLTTYSGNDGLPTWSPDGQTIAFVSEQADGWEMWAIDADGENARSLFELGGSIDGIVQIDVVNAWGWFEETIDWSP